MHAEGGAAVFAEHDAVEGGELRDVLVVCCAGLDDSLVAGVVLFDDFHVDIAHGS